MAAKSRGIGVSDWKPVKIDHRTSIGKSPRSRPKNKHKRRSFKKYRGQGK